MTAAKKDETPAHGDATGLQGKNQNRQAKFTPDHGRPATSGLAPIETILDRLEMVRQRQPGQYSARCPAHEDKGPSLSVREKPDGSVLIHCFAECAPYEILAAIGLELHDLYPPRNLPPGTPKRIARLLTAEQALELLFKESFLVAVAAGNVAHGVALSQADLDRVLLAASRVNWLRAQSLGGRHVQF